jgi:flagellar protein FliJ
MLRQRRVSLQEEQSGLAGRERQLKSPGVADVDALLQAHRYEIVLAAQMRQLNDQIAQVVAESERRRQVLVEADRQVRVLEKLRDRQATTHRQEEQRLETKQFDELALVGYTRRREVRP